VPVKLKAAIDALPLLDGGKVIYLVGKFADAPKPGFEDTLSVVAARRVVIFHWMTSIGIESDAQERIYKHYAKDYFENPVLLGLDKVPSLKLGIGDMRYSFLLPNENKLCYDFVEGESLADTATMLETVIICDTQESLRRFLQRCNHASKAPTK
jgi:hypothetical protein